MNYRDRQRPADIHAILQATVDDDLPELERAIHGLAASLPDHDLPADLG